MKYAAWTWKAIEARIIEMADTLRLVPAHYGPREFGSPAIETVKSYEEAYGFHAARYSETASAASLGRMEEVFGWINGYLCEADRKLIYAWSWVKVRSGMKISAFAAENDLSDRMLRREITRICQLIANDLNRRMLVRLNSDDCALSENQPELDQSDVTSNNCGTVRKNGIAFDLAPDARPILDLNNPELAVLNDRLEEANRRREREARRRAKLQVAA